MNADQPKPTVDSLPTRRLGSAAVDISDNAAVRDILDADEDSTYRGLAIAARKTRQTQHTS